MEQDVEFVGPIRPNPEQFEQVWSAFFSIVSVVARARADEFGKGRLGNLAHSAAWALTRLPAQQGLREALAQAFSDEDEGLAASLLFEELLYIILQHPGADFDAYGLAKDILAQAQSDDAEVPEASGSAFDPAAVHDIATVLQSIPKVLSKLPVWMQKLIHVLLEFLQLIRP